jgi:quercetin dioxygenase-like cupin family protein
MHRHLTGLLVLTTAVTAGAQELQAPGTVTAVESGIVATVLMDRREVRVLRVEVAPGALRSQHAHEDVRFHVFVPLSGTVDLIVGTQTSKIAPGQSHYFESGTMHGWKNPGHEPAAIMEVFVKEGCDASAQ